MNTINAASPNINAVVSASAGTGKTWLLIARLLRLLLDGNLPASILAITFTEKAAAEISQRLRERLRHWTRINNTDLTAELKTIGVHQCNTDTLHTARLLYERLISAEEPIQIMTFHAFCGELLRSFPFEASVPVNFDTLDETWEVRKTAMKQLFIQAVRPGNTALFEALQTLTNHTQTLNATTKSLEDFLNYHNDWRKFIENDADPVTDSAERLRVAMDIDPKSPVIFPKTLHTLLNQHLELLALHNTKDFIARIEHIQAIQQAEQVDDEVLQHLKSAFFTQQNEPRKTRESNAFFKKLAANGSNIDQFSCIFNEVVEAIRTLEHLFLAKAAWHLNLAWYTAGNRLLEIYDNLKRNRQALDFSDLEWFANRLLQAPEMDAVHYHLSQKIRHILIDEFQDTSNSQWHLLLPLLKEMAAHDNGGSIFIVGDIKQSIYGFRRANPQLQIEVTAWLQQNMHGKKYTLDASRRSSQTIIDLVNAVFTSPPYQNQLSEFRQHTTEVETAGVVGALPFIHKEKANEKPSWRPILKVPPPTQEDTAHQHEAELVVNKITELIDQKTSISNPQSALPRELRYGDIMVLLRTRRHIALFEEAMEQAGIPFISSSADKLLKSWEVNDMLALLRFLSDSDDNLSLVQVLRSPIFSASDEHLIALAQCSQKHWFEAILELADSHPLWKRAAKLLKRWLPLRDKIPIHDMLDTIYADAAVIQRYRMSVAAEEADLTQNNLLQLLNYALDFESGRYPEVRDFLQHIENRTAYYAAYSSGETAVTIPQAHTSDHVHILTIHQAKGLEAPVVFLADCGKRIGRSNAYKTLVSWPSDEPRPTDFLLLPKQKHLDWYTNRCLEKQHQRDAREEANLLYVAITRARQYLFVSGSGDDSQDSWYHTLSQHMPICEEPVSSTAALNKKAAVPVAAPPAETIAAPALLTEWNPSKLTTFETGYGAEQNRIRGEVIHRALDLLTRQSPSKQTLRQLTGEFNLVEAEQINIWLKHAVNLMQRAELQALFDNNAYQQTFNELPIVFMHREQQFSGVIDRLCLNEDTAWLVDYKTHSHAAERMEALKNHYYEQMRIYHIGVSLLYPHHRIRSSLLLTDNAALIDYAFSKDELAETILPA